MDKKLTDNEIVKALKCCNEWENPGDCTNCPAKGKGDCCVLTLRIAALDLINHLQAENEKLNAELKNLTTVIKNLTSENQNLTSYLVSANAENERLKEEVTEHIKKGVKKRKYDIALIKAESYKECIEKVKEKSKKTEIVCSGALVTISYAISNKNLDNLLKELVGGENNVN